MADLRARQGKWLLALVVATGAAAGAFVAYAAVTGDFYEPTYRVGPTKECFEQRGHVVVNRSEPDTTHMYIDEKDLPYNKRGPYPHLVFFQNGSAAREYAEGDSIPLIRRGNVVLDYERYDASAESRPEVRAVTKCLRPKATQ